MKVGDSRSEWPTYLLVSTLSRGNASEVYRFPLDQPRRAFAAWQLMQRCAPRAGIHFITSALGWKPGGVVEWNNETSSRSIGKSCGTRLDTPYPFRYHPRTFSVKTGAGLRGEEMLLYVRIVFALNALYQTAFGLVCLLGPGFAIMLYGGTAAEQEATLLMLAFRAVGIGLVPIGVMSALVAGSPDDTPVLRAMMGLTAVLTFVCWGIVIGSHDLSAGQIATVVLDCVVQLPVIVGAVFYRPKNRFPKITINRRSIAA